MTPPARARRTPTPTPTPTLRAPTTGAVDVGEPAPTDVGPRAALHRSGGAVVPLAQGAEHGFGSVPSALAVARLLSPDALVAARVAGERQFRQRIARLFAVGRDARRERRRPRRPRMASLWVSTAGRVQWRDVAAPGPPERWAATVEPVAMATCDLDRPLALGATPFPRPLHLGHECVARVSAVGAEVTTVAVGDLVVVPFQVSCGLCSSCRRGRSGSCRTVPPLSMFGFGAGGGAWGGVMAEQVAVPYADAMLVPLPCGVDPAAAASAGDTLSEAYRHVAPHLDVLENGPGQPTVIIVGAVDRRSSLSPSVAFYAAQIVDALAPAATCVVIDRRDWVRREGQRVGVEVSPPRRLRGLQAPLVIDCSFDRRGLALAVQATAADGLCSCAGTLHKTVPIPGALMYGRNITLALGRSHIRTVMPEVLALMAAGRLHPEKVINCIAPFTQAPEAISAHLKTATTKTIIVRDPLMP